MMKCAVLPGIVCRDLENLSNSNILTFAFFLFFFFPFPSHHPICCRSLIVHSEAGQLNKDPSLCHISNATLCQASADCYWNDASSSSLGFGDDLWGPDYGMSVAAAAASCEPACFGQDKKLTECTNAKHATILCILGGAINLVMGILNFGFIVDFISYPVISGT